MGVRNGVVGVRTPVGTVLRVVSNVSYLTLGRHQQLVGVNPSQVPFLIKLVGVNPSQVASTCQFQ